MNDTNPFTQWLPMYPPGTLPERPWWRKPAKISAWNDLFGAGWPAAPVTLDSDQRVRVDGLTLVLSRKDGMGAGLGWCFLATNAEGRTVGKRASTVHETGWPPDDDGVAAAMAWLDAHQPLPAPPPMCDAVWATRGSAEIRGATFVISDVRPYARVVPERDTHWDVGGGLILFGRTSTAECNNDWEEWPPKNAVLVAGPSPWGRDRPWAPKGWQP